MNDRQSDTVQQPVKPTQPTGIARRRLLRAGLAATPVILTLSGRSAMAAAGDSCQKGLSPLAWNSLAPDGTVCTQNSHTVTPNNLGDTPAQWDQKATPSNIGGIRFKAVFQQSTNNSRINKILKESTTSIDAFYATAYCNAATYPTYAITVDELKTLYKTKKLVSTANVQLTDNQIAAFLAQTWGA